MAEVKRICDCCGSDRTLVGQGITCVYDFRGNSFALIGFCCRAEVTRMLNKLCNKYGGYVDENGTMKASPYGSPSIRSIEHLREEIGEGDYGVN